MMELYAAAKSAGPDTGLEESMWRLGLGGGEAAAQLPERPGEADCVYYLRTGACGYGENCRYSHPRDRFFENTQKLVDVDGSFGLKLLAVN